MRTSARMLRCLLSWPSQSCSKSCLKVPIECSLLLDGSTNEGSPFGPGAVIVADIGVTQELGEYEPGMGTTLADAAVSDCRMVGGDPFAAVEGGQLVLRLEGAILGHGR